MGHACEAFLQQQAAGAIFVFPEAMTRGAREQDDLFLFRARGRQQGAKADEAREEEEGETCL
jgi:hypothetical protein